MLDGPNLSFAKTRQQLNVLRVTCHKTTPYAVHFKRALSSGEAQQLEKLTLAPWASRRRQELLELLDRIHPTIEELTAAVEREARKRPEALRLMTHPGVGPLTALAYVLII